MTNQYFAVADGSTNWDRRLNVCFVSLMIIIKLLPTFSSLDARQLLELLQINVKLWYYQINVSLNWV